MALALRSFGLRSTMCRWRGFERPADWSARRRPTTGARPASGRIFEYGPAYHPRQCAVGILDNLVCLALHRSCAAWRLAKTRTCAKHPANDFIREEQQKWYASVPSATVRMVC